MYYFTFTTMTGEGDIIVGQVHHTKDPAVNVALCDAMTR